MPKSNALVLGVDPSSRAIAFVAKHPLTNTIAHRKYKLPGTNGPYSPERAEAALHFTMEFLDGIGSLSQTRVAYIEEPVAGGRNTAIRSAIVQAYVNGVVQAAMKAAGYDVTLVSSTTWKKVIIGKAHASKEEIAVSVGRKWPKFYHAVDGDQDLVDAAGICRYGIWHHAVAQ